jgi:superoxide reductase
MKKQRCKVCAWIYDPAATENVAFEDLPEDWKCPVCGVGKDQFEELHHMGEEQTGGEAQEKHVPVVSGDESKTVVTVGSVEHPMTEEHHILWVELHEGDKVVKKIDLAVGNLPVATFEGIPYKAEYKAIAFCNLHGIWESE